MPPDTEQPRVSRRGLQIAAISAIVVAAALVFMGISTRRIADARLSEWTENQALPVVVVALPATQAKQVTIELPGRLEAYMQAQIFARVSGYIKDWKADIGTRVKAGQLLAEIDAPDLDQQIMQAKAAVASAQANAVLSKATLERGQSLIVSGAVSKQDIDQRVADFANKEGLVRAAQANLDRLQVLEQYKRITAPFAGIVTSRTTDVGALINAGSSGGTALFVVSDIRRLRAYINVPQTYVPKITLGTEAQISVPEYPGRSFSATVEASAQAVDATSGTTRMLLLVDNSDGKLMSGAFASVRLKLAAPAIAVNVPASALIFNQGGLSVATVGADNRVILRSVTIARDLGKTLDIGSGLTAKDRVIENPPDGTATGDQVRIAGSSGEIDKRRAAATKPNSSTSSD
jgi:RND family efflux transporter MFP subunit